MVGRAGAHCAVVGVLRIGFSASVANGGLEDALALRGREVLQEDVFCAPEAARGERRDLRGAVAWYREGRTGVEVGVGVRARTVGGLAGGEKREGGDAYQTS